MKSVPTGDLGSGMRVRERIARFIAPGLRNDEEIRALVADEIARAKMALPMTANYDPKGEGYRPASGAVSQRRNLTYIDQFRMFEIAYFMWETSAMFRRLAVMDRSFIFADPVVVKSDDPDVQDILDRFREDPENRLDTDFPNHAMWLSILGEQCWPVTVNPYNGAVRLAYVDPTNIREVYVNSLNIKQVLQVEVQESAGRTNRLYNAIHKDYNISSKTYDRLVGDCLYFSINHPPNQPRGRSDYLTLFDWIDALERYGFNYLERAEFMLNFVWDVSLKGMNADQIREWMRDNPPPQPGSMRAHNENVEWNAVAPDLKATDFTSGFDMGKGFVMGAVGRPDSWFGSGGKAYQTEAELFGQVPMRDLDLRQRELKYNLMLINQFALDQAVIAGRISPAKAETGFEVQMPEIAKKDVTKLAAALPQIQMALSGATADKWITRDTATWMFAYICSYLGYEIDAQAQIDEAAKAPPDDETDYEAMLNARVGGQGPGIGDEE